MSLKLPERERLLLDQEPIFRHGAHCDSDIAAHEAHSRIKRNDITGDGYPGRVSRRRVLALLGLAGASVELAGCASFIFTGSGQPTVGMQHGEAVEHSEEKGDGHVVVNVLNGEKTEEEIKCDEKAAQLKARFPGGIPTVKEGPLTKDDIDLIKEIAAFFSECTRFGYTMVVKDGKQIIMNKTEYEEYASKRNDRLNGVQATAEAVEVKAMSCQRIMQILSFLLGVGYVAEIFIMNTPEVLNAEYEVTQMKIKDQLALTTAYVTLQTLLEWLKSLCLKVKVEDTGSGWLRISPFTLE